MRYCESCHCLADERCLLCGGLGQREVTSDDYCFLCEISWEEKYDFKMLLGEHIPCVFQGIATAIQTKFALPIQRYRVFLPFSFYEEAVQRLRDVEEKKTSRLKASLLENADKLFVKTEKVAKKFCKKLKLSPSENLLEKIVEKIKFSSSVVDGGLTTSLPQGAHYLFVYCDERIITVNSLTFEIIAID